MAGQEALTSAPLAGGLRFANAGGGATGRPPVSRAGEALGIVYYSSASLNTHRFVAKLGWPAERIPPPASGRQLVVSGPYVLIVPTYGGGHDSAAVPRPVIGFLNHEPNRAWLRGVIASGNTNFGTAYGLAGDIVAAKCQVPCLAKFELMGTPCDVRRVRDGLTEWWTNQ